jgi:hypothetical protein
MRINETFPTYAETYDSLSKISDIVNRALLDLGKIEGKNALGSEEELRYLVLDISKKIVQNLPSYQFDRGDIDHAESMLSTTLNRASDEEA